jgi:hypothetical protein
MKYKKIFLQNLQKGYNNCFHAIKIFTEATTTVFMPLKFLQRLRQLFSCCKNFYRGYDNCFHACKIFTEATTLFYHEIKENLV